MKLLNAILIISILLLSCNGGQKNEKNNTAGKEEKQTGESEQAQFFPVTDFLKGQVAEIKTKGINPIITTIKGKHLDSAWLKVENMDEAFSPFLSPVIDSSDMVGMFTEKKFLDQTINAFTFTYDPLKPLPDSFLLRRWDVYVDPESNTVRRIFMIKKTRDHKTLQLTWQTKESCRIVTIATDAKGNDYVEKEVTIKWDF